MGSASAAWPADAVPVPLGGDRAALLDPRRWSGTAMTGSAVAPVGDRGRPSHGHREDARFPESVPPAVWISDTGWNADDGAMLRRALNGRYDAFARMVTRTLAEEPGMRAVGSQPDLVSELVALCAYHAGERGAVNAALRRIGGQGDADPQVTLLARGALRGLWRLPAVLGPVFAAGDDPDAARTYRPGDELVEPAFVDVDTNGGHAHDAPVEYVIWSVTAHQMGRLTPGRPVGAVFPPGSRFTVMAIDPPADAHGPLRVLLRDRAGERTGHGDAGTGRLVDRLRGTKPSDPEHRAVCRLAFAPGLDQHGRRFVRPDSTVDPYYPQKRGHVNGRAPGVGLPG